MTLAETEALVLLKKHFGFDSFRPLQREIIDDALAGRDVLALLPTGGGKSLCFQFAAVAQPGLTVVVSPLIALMKDQVDALKASGIPATFLNSSLGPGESRPRLRGLHNGEYQLLYVAPERLMLPGFLEDLRRWKLKLIAIDEAHCISEWGHDFRPEYRQLAQMRELFPGVPMMALTATATERVRQDIALQLRLRDPARYVASFNRPNLVYQVMAKSQPANQVLEFVRARPHDSGIIYCQSRKQTEDVASRLERAGVAAKPYHAGLTPKERTDHQEAFLRDEVRVICATIAFGMGINKPNVRFVLHFDLPKNVEGYYQETGRAGRDGLPGDCVLLFSPGDVIKHQRFIEEKTPAEQVIARQQLQQIVHYADSAGCRRRELLRYFGEEFDEENCGACDNCLKPRATYDGTLAAQKLLSCVYRIREKSGFGVGLNHVVEVLTGAESEKVLRWGHQQLSTYGIGRDQSRPEWQAVGRELVRLGFLRQVAEKMGILELTDEGRAALRERRKITLTKPIAVAEKKPRIGDIACDEELFEKLRQLRRRLADERNVAAYIVFSDVTLRQMARDYPTDPAALARLSGVGERKLAEFGQVFAQEVRAFLENHPRQMFADESFTPSASLGVAALNGTSYETLKRFRSGQTVAQIAAQRGMSTSTIFGHLAAAIECGEAIDLSPFLDLAAQKEIDAAFAKLGDVSLGAVREHLGNRYDYGPLRLFRAARQRGQTMSL